MSFKPGRIRIAVSITLFLTIAGFSLMRFGRVAIANLEPLFFVPTITATKIDTIQTDVDGDARLDPGDTVKYTVTINNAGTDATGVRFADTVDANTTLVGGSI